MTPKDHAVAGSGGRGGTCCLDFCELAGLGVELMEVGVMVECVSLGT